MFATDNHAKENTLASSLCFTGGTAILPDRLIPDAVVVCSNDKITYVGQSQTRVPKQARIVDAKGGWISPGFVDIHVHGGGGSDFMDGTSEAIQQSCVSHARHGTTTLFPTTTTGSTQQIHAMLDATAKPKAGALRWEPALLVFTCTAPFLQRIKSVVTATRAALSVKRNFEHTSSQALSKSRLVPQSSPGHPLSTATQADITAL